MWNWRDHVVTVVCCSRSACLLLCFVILGRPSGRHCYGPIGPYHFVCTGWSNMGLSQGNLGIGWFSSPCLMWQQIVQLRWYWGRLKFCCQQQFPNTKTCLQIFVLNWCWQNLMWVHHWHVLHTEPSFHSLAQHVYTENILAYCWYGVSEGIVWTCGAFWQHTLAWIIQHARRCSLSLARWLCIIMLPNTWRWCT